MPQQKSAGRFRRSAQLFDDDVFAHFTRRVNKKSSEKRKTMPMACNRLLTKLLQT